MELLTLDDTYQPTALIENYNSLIWTERYATNGDFELKSYDIGNTMAAIPLESTLTLRDSTVPMLAEVYKIEKPKGQAPILTITGRSFETVLERRVSVNALPTLTSRQAWLESATKPSDAAYQAIRKVIGDIPRYQNGVQVLPILGPACAPEDAIPQINLPLPADYASAPPAWSATTAYSAGDFTSYGGTIWMALLSNTNVTPVAGPTWIAASYEIKPGDLYSAVMELLAINYHGFKAVRPPFGGNQVDLEIYNGADRRENVVFDVRFDQFDSATYLLSQQGSATSAYVFGSTGSSEILKDQTYRTGLDRRVLYVDISSENGSSTQTVQKSRGLIELYKYNATALFDGQISDTVAAGYNTKYFLGDIVRMTGEYGLSNDVRVAEFIRSSDSGGEKAYPTFEVISSS